MHPIFKVTVYLMSATSDIKINVTWWNVIQRFDIWFGIFPAGHLMNWEDFGQAQGKKGNSVSCGFRGPNFLRPPPFSETPGAPAGPAFSLLPTPDAASWGGGITQTAMCRPPGILPCRAGPCWKRAHAMHVCYGDKNWAYLGPKTWPLT